MNATTTQTTDLFTHSAALREARAIRGGHRGTKGTMRGVSVRKLVVDDVHGWIVIGPRVYRPSGLDREIYYNEAGYAEWASEAAI